VLGGQAEVDQPNATGRVHADVLKAKVQVRDGVSVLEGNCCSCASLQLAVALISEFQNR
jgi:hypothetical protein